MMDACASPKFHPDAKRTRDSLPSTAPEGIADRGRARWLITDRREDTGERVSIGVGRNSPAAQP